MKYKMFNFKNNIYFFPIILSFSFSNFLRLPFIASEYGGGAFLFVFCVFLFILGLPVFISELISQDLIARNIEIFKNRLRNNKILFNLNLISSVFSLFVLIYYSLLSASILILVAQFLNFFLGFINLGNFINYEDFLTKDIYYYVAFSFVHFLILILFINRGEILKKILFFLIPLAFGIVLFTIMNLIAKYGSENLIKVVFYPRFEDFGFKSVYFAFSQVCFTLILGVGLQWSLFFKRKDEKINLPSYAIKIVLISLVICLLAAAQFLGSFYLINQINDKNFIMLFQILPVYFSESHYGIMLGLIFFSALYLVSLFTSLIFVEGLLLNIFRLFKINRRLILISIELIIFLGLIIFFFIKKYSQISIIDLILKIDYVVVNLVIPFLSVAFSWMLSKWVSKRVLEEKFISEDIIETRILFFQWLSIIKYVLPIFVFIFFILSLV